MLTLYDKSRLGRRDFLKIGSLSLGGLSLPNLFTAAAAAAESSGGVLRDKAVIFCFMHGGPSQIETFDPKMTAPPGIRSLTGEISTTIPGVTFGSTFPKLAAMADKLSVVRSFATGDARHDIKPIVHGKTLDANLGSLYTRVAGTTHPTSGMPRNSMLFPKAVDSSCRPGTRSFGRFASTGNLGSAYAPFQPGSGGNLQEDMKLHVPMQRLEDRRYLLNTLDQAKWAVDEVPQGMDRIREQAFSTIMGGVSDAFDLSKEDPKTLARYDTSHIARPDNIDRKWNNYNNYVDNGKSLGKLLLLARRLCERGCGFVTVTTNFVWDMHSDSNNAGVVEGMGYIGSPFDHAVSALIEDLEQRGLSDKILLICCGEMGRTPKVNSRGGRDHWGNLAPLLLSGGGLNMGHVVGQSTSDASQPHSDPVVIEDLVSTILHTLLDVGQLRIARGVPTDIVRAATAGKLIPGLM